MRGIVLNGLLFQAGDLLPPFSSIGDLTDFRLAKSTKPWNPRQSSGNGMKMKLVNSRSTMKRQQNSSGSL